MSGSSDNLKPGSDGMNTASPTLGESLPLEIQRCQDLLVQYKAIGPVGAFGHAMISAEIAEAHKAMMEGDLVGMLRAYEKLKRCN
jgi:hypothetical protein